MVILSKNGTPELVENLPKIDALEKQTFTNVIFLDISNSILTDCNFKSCKFNAVNLSRIELTNCSFTNCEFNAVNFHKTEFLNSTFDSCIFTGSNLTRTYFDRTSENRDDCLIRNCQFLRCHLAGTMFSGGKLQDPVFVNSSLQGVSFLNFELIHPKFTQTVMENCAGFETTLIYHLDAGTDLASFLKVVDEP